MSAWIAWASNHHSFGIERSELERKFIRLVIRYHRNICFVLDSVWIKQWQNEQDFQEQLFFALGNVQAMEIVL